MPLDYSAINTKNISNVKQKWSKTNAIGIYKKDIRQITLLKKLKYKRLTLKKSIQNNSNLVLVSNLSIDLGNCWYFILFIRSKVILLKI